MTAQLNNVLQLLWGFFFLQRWTKQVASGDVIADLFLQAKLFVFLIWCQILLTSTLMDSMTSIKTSFFLYLIPSDLQETALVTVVGTLDFATSSLVLFWVMYLQEARWQEMAGCDSTPRSLFSVIFTRLHVCVGLGEAHSCRILLSVVWGNPKSISSSSSS